MGELEIPRSDENLEPQEDDTKAQRELDDITHEPRTYVEESGDYQQAEDIQSDLTEVVENLGTGAENEGATPLPIPRPEEQGLAENQSDVRNDLDQATSVAGESGRDEATPINLPNMQETMADDKGATPLPIPRPEDQGLVGGQPGVRGDLDQAESGKASRGRDEATPINLPDPQPAETPELGPNPFPQPLDTPGDTLDEVGDYTESGEPSPPPGEGLTLEGTELLNESGEPLVPLDESLVVTEDGQFLVVGAEDALAIEGMDPKGEMDPEALADAKDTSPVHDWYLHDDGEGNLTVVDADGNSVKAPPKIIYFNGKYYAAYPGDVGFKEDGSAFNPANKLQELPNYKVESGGMYVHDDGDGNLTVVDADGNSVKAPPKIIYFNGKYYAAYPGDVGFKEDGSAFNPANKLQELPNYKVESGGMYVHDDGDGNLTVVDADGNSVKAPPKIIYFNGKYYAAYPGDVGFKEDGSAFNPANKLQELPNYKVESGGMYVHDDGDGNLTVVDAEGNSVKASPKIIYQNGKYYAAYPGDSGFAEDGSITDTSKLTELPNYKGSAEGMYVHDDGDGNLTVVDAEGNSVKASPKIIYQNGKYYAAYPGDSGFAEDGSITDTSKLTELPNYKGSAEGMYVHDDGDGNLTVVDADGNSVKAPPKIIEVNGKYYAAYPGDEGFDEKGGTAISYKNLTELPNYKPPWWKFKY